ncbi:pyruvate carboxylase [Lacticaseibacillus sharpeae]|uniref:Pyruvate carboxylase n=1 Tax=Lacticaseibacillus sharpeae JCM 1186 = DSM 20505 TaxID=1291052 RepID=A0A0R1ZVX1_9LACO|nr:pyruvate carboxylase [Lacticaseibacillus sharpeae]KRM55945.1 pyruvate carboxylase [Lacticaseibacillus sharpeae JCM 1186 = DSM 20505]
MQKVLVANRGEIAIRIFRACEELGLKTVGIYAKEDSLSIHRFKAQESFQVGAGREPIAAYLDMDDIIRIAKESGADAIHPGYGLLSENAEFAAKVRAAGLTFVGPSTELLKVFGDKVAAKEAAVANGLQVIPGTPEPTRDFAEIQAFADKYGFPLMLKSASGGGGRGMRVVRNQTELEHVYPLAKSEALTSFGDDRMYIERYIEHAKHIEVQVMGDGHGHLLHLFERDCSVQRRNQKVVEIAPAVGLPIKLRQDICNAAAKFMAAMGYENAGTIEFLVENGQFYFIEVNPRIQVEHTVTEAITGLDIVQAQLRVAAGADLFADLDWPHQDELTAHGAAIQCRITTEDPLNNFMPDTGTITTYRSPGGLGVRLDVGNAYAGAVVSPFFDSLLVKASVTGYNFAAACAKMDRVLHEFRIIGVKTNLPFLETVISHPVFRSGQAETRFIDNSPELFTFRPQTSMSNEVLNYIGDVTVNGFQGKDPKKPRVYPELRFKNELPQTQPKTDLVQLLHDGGAKAVTNWISDQPQLLLTDTSFRDAHQSLFATRMRTHDMLRVAGEYSNALPNLFSAEMWGGATFDVAYRFLNEDPWQRLAQMRKALPHTLLQMLFRGSNAVGYKNYPDNVIKEFINQAAKTGIDVFRIFDSLNWVKQMEPSIAAVKETGKIAEATICYTGDILSAAHPHYTLQYYVDLAKQLEKAGADMLAVKDMAALLTPGAASVLIAALKDAVTIPVHLHTHDTTGTGLATYIAAANAGVDVVDVAQSSFSGTTSQPSMESLYHALAGDKRQPELDIAAAEHVNDYFRQVRPYYEDFANNVSGPLTRIYDVEMPGGQYTNLQQQAQGVGVSDFNVVMTKYAEVNKLFGDIIKVTPSSKVVGDMALFMAQNDLDADDVMAHGAELDFPESVVNFFKGELGQPPFGFPKQLQKMVLKGAEPLTSRPGEVLEPVDLDQVASQLRNLGLLEPTEQDVLSAVLYPDVFKKYLQNQKKFGPVTHLDTPTYFQGMRVGQQVNITVAPGRAYVIRLDAVGEADATGLRNLYFTVNGQKREIEVIDRGSKHSSGTHQLAEPNDPQQVGAPMAGRVLTVLVKPGQKVNKGDELFVSEAMKMETTVHALVAGTVTHVYVEPGALVASGELLAQIKE